MFAYRICTLAANGSETKRKTLSPRGMAWCTQFRANASDQDKDTGLLALDADGKDLFRMDILSILLVAN